VISANSVLIPFTQHKLSSGQRYFWKVRVWDEKDKALVYSKNAFWEMGLLKNNDWQAKWISAPKVYDWANFVANRKLLIKQGEKENDAAPQFRRSFQVTKKLTRARLYISGCGYNVPV
jgi:alpha-L-rhamnosidase